MNIITQEARKQQAIVKYAEKNGKSSASRMYGVSLSSVNGGAKDMTEHGSHCWKSHTDRTATRTGTHQERNVK